MNTTKKMMVLIFMAAVCTAMASAQQSTIKKRKMSVMVAEDKNCPQGISVSARFAGSGPLCVDYPEGVSYQFQELVGSTVEVEALWTFDGGLKRETPVGLGQVLSIGGEKVAEKVNATGATKTHSSQKMPMATNGNNKGKNKVAASTPTVASPACQASTATASAAIFEIRNRNEDPK